MTFSLPDYPLAFWVTTGVAIVLLGVAKAGIAGGVAVVATPLAALTVPVSEAAGTLLPLLIITDILALAYYRRDFDRGSIKILLPGSLVGIAAGALFFGFFIGKDSVLRGGIGMLALLFVLFQVGRATIFRRIEGWRPSAPVGVVMGAFAGFASTIAHAGGPPLTMYLLPQKMPKHLYVGTNAVFFAVTNALKLVPYVYLGLLPVGNPATVAILAPLCFVGVKIGVALNRRFNETWFNRVVYTVLFLAGVHLIVTAWMEK